MENQQHQTGADTSETVTMSTTAFVDRIDPFAKRSLKKKSRKSQGSSRYRNSQDVELQPLPLLKGESDERFRRGCHDLVQCMCNVTNHASELIVRVHFGHHIKTDHSWIGPHFAYIYILCNCRWTYTGCLQFSVQRMVEKCILHLNSVGAAYTRSGLNG